MCENVHIAHSLTTLVHKKRLFPSHFTNPQENVDISGIPLFDAIFGRGITLHSLELPMGPSINYVVSKSAIFDPLSPFLVVFLLSKIGNF